jgi:hypothetical protein
MSTSGRASGSGPRSQNRQAILDAAREVFGELGYDAATVRDIIRRTGLASGTFYNYYKLQGGGVRRPRRRRRPPLLGRSSSGCRVREGTDFEAFLRGAIRAYLQLPG